MELDSKGAVVKRFNVTTVWPGGSTEVPDDEPPCVFHPEECRGKYSR